MDAQAREQYVRKRTGLVFSCRDISITHNSVVVMISDGKMVLIFFLGAIGLTGGEILTHDT